MSYQRLHGHIIEWLHRRLPFVLYLDLPKAFHFVLFLNLCHTTILVPKTYYLIQITMNDLVLAFLWFHELPIDLIIFLISMRAYAVICSSDSCSWAMPSFFWWMHFISSVRYIWVDCQNWFVSETSQWIRIVANSWQSCFPIVQFAASWMHLTHSLSYNSPRA